MSMHDHSHGEGETPQGSFLTCVYRKFDTA
jgi:hypothetical protein